MKRILALICCLTVIISFSSCGNTDPIDIRGLENFSCGDSPLELTLMVPEGFIDEYQYVSGDYFYHLEHEGMAEHFEKFIVFVKYDDQTYNLAKVHALNSNKISEAEESPELNIGNYIFYKSGLVQTFKNAYNSAIYMYVTINEPERMVCFLCVRSSYTMHKERAEKIDNLYETEGLKGLIDEYFIEWYDFYATNNA